MNKTDREIMEMALNTLVNHTTIEHPQQRYYRDQAIDALRERLAQSEQETIKTWRVKTWRERCEEHPDHEGIVSERMIHARMQEEIDDLRERLEQHESS